MATAATVLGVSVSAHCRLDCLSTQGLERDLTDTRAEGTGCERGREENKNGRGEERKENERGYKESKENEMRWRKIEKTRGEQRKGDI